MAKKRIKPDFGDGTGDPTLDEELAEEGGPSFHRSSDRQEAEQALIERIVNLDKQAADQGIEDREWFHDETASEYHEYRKGLPQSVQRDEHARGQKAIEGISRQELDGMKADHWANAEWADDLYSDYRDVYGGDYSSEEVGKAAERVAERYRLEGSRSVARKIAKNREQFLDDVSTELVMGGGGSHDGGQAHRTAGTSLGGGRGYSGPMKDSEDGKPMVSEIQEWQKKEGYV
jgi:hypothetical protein